MKSIFLTGSSGFIGKYLKSYFNNQYSFFNCQRNNDINISQDVVIHLAGKAHDLKNVTLAADYYFINSDYTKKVFDTFLVSDAKVFIFLSSVKAVADNLECELTEEYTPNPITHYGKSKLLAEQYILSKQIPQGKRVHILRPCMIHGPGNKGNLNLLYKIVIKGFPWPLGKFENKRSFCSIDNLCFIIREIIESNQISSGIYNIADDDPLSTNELIKLISESQGKKYLIWNTPKLLIKTFSKFGDLMRLPINSEKLSKLTETYIVSNHKIKKTINKPLPMTAKDGLLKTFDSFNKIDTN